ncbi:hypothetical protein LCGC14_0295210 [marine sediment metagenome]|uniref:N-acetylmuramoyl-L-alanine amidase n=1 Tax=marine sediment metagenome TaxID=412755 RepID=A0A0F9WXX6_9ZZZZ
MNELWFPGARRDPGPAWKVSGQPHPKKGTVYHSMVGSWASAVAVLNGSEESSWQFSILKSGETLQHYEVTAWAWHCGDRDDPAGEISNNRDLDGIEFEGGPIGNESEPLTEAQVAAAIKLTAWLLEQGHLPNLRRTGDNRGRWEHNEIIPTACPSHRIPHQKIQQGVVDLEEDDMTPQEMLKQMLTLNVPIWGATGPVTLSQLLHYAYHGSPTEHQGFATYKQILQVAKIAVTNRDGLQAANDAIAEHLAVHNSSGGVIDRSTGEFVAKLAALLGQMGDDIDELAETFE